LNYEDAKRLIYIPAYKYVLENVPSVKRSLEKIRTILETRDVVFLDYNLNPDNADKSLLYAFTVLTLKPRSMVRCSTK
jgi:hypothetical protein